MTRIAVVYYSAFGHVYEMAQAAARGAAAMPDTEVRLLRIGEEALEPEAYRSGPGGRTPAGGGQQEDLTRVFDIEGRVRKYRESREQQRGVPPASVSDLEWADGVVWGFPTYYGMMPAQMKLFLERAGLLNLTGGLEGKPAGLLTSAGSIHTGHEAALLTAMVPLLHFGMIIVGSPYTENPEYLTTEGIGGTPYGPSTLAGPDSSLRPDPRELAMAERLGARVAGAAGALAPWNRSRREEKGAPPPT
ncbi:flavoprotein WrbA [Paenibacillus mucilaginosus 3016]|uniref:Flavoprotein WrbA n=1 Tax=Paenibacillus mucilaginosus 3016 TaxID=1116391 RepID=H6NLA7_9BACL|nr:NAD(P)H-dependent oxidoreductase [Paenibacillus mucilaginosus]AFC30289.1 flavoprotein WrbA [Paenibacillus mucilaginosus 3016]